MGKWYRVGNAGKKSILLDVAKVLRRLLIDANSLVDINLQSTLELLTPDDTCFELEDIVGHHEMILVGRSSVDYEVRLK